MGKFLGAKMSKVKDEKDQAMRKDKGFQGVLSYAFGNSLPEKLGPLDTTSVDQFFTGASMVGGGVLSLAFLPVSAFGAATMSAVLGLSGLYQSAAATPKIAKGFYDAIRGEGIVAAPVVDVAEGLTALGPIQIPVALAAMAQHTMAEVRDKGPMVVGGVVKAAAAQIENGFGLSTRGFKNIVEKSVKSGEGFAARAARAAAKEAMGITEKAQPHAPHRAVKVQSFIFKRQQQPKHARASRRGAGVSGR